MVFLGTSYGENILCKQNLVLYFHFFLFSVAFSGEHEGVLHSQDTYNVSLEPGITPSEFHTGFGAWLGSKIQGYGYRT